MQIVSRGSDKVPALASAGVAADQAVGEAIDEAAAIVSSSHKKVLHSNMQTAGFPPF
ncbi:MAG TPA: hypothetical protein PLC34_14690 [Burkholderiaceae bacterium]|nr:hypothetical protein [Burkholderiaceae bacterium]